MNDWDYNLPGQENECARLQKEIGILRAELEESRLLLQKYKQVFYSSRTMMVISRIRDGEILAINDACEAITGYRREELLGKNVFEVQAIDHASRQTMLQQFKEAGYIKDFENQFIHKSGEIGYTLSSSILIEINNEDCLLSNIIDISKIKNVQDEMCRLENLQNVGELAASIAHEIRNPMTTIKGFLQLFIQQQKFSEDQETMELMLYELDRINEIIGMFLSLTRNKEINITSGSLNESISNLLPLFRVDATKSNVKILTELQEIPPVMFDEGEIRCLLINLVRNGFEAMSDGGTLSIKTFKDNKGVNLVIEDQGTGMTADVFKKLGTPFFSSKGNGTGLGLLACNSIAARHKAPIGITTGPEGTCVTVTFPATA